MLKRLVVALVGLAGVVVVALGVASATLWRADDVLVAQLRADEPVVVTEPGVLELAATEVTVSVEADGPVVLAVGRDTDVDGWVGDDAHQRVTGLAGWHELAADDVAAAPATAAPADGDAASEGDSGEGDATGGEGDAPADDAAEDEAAAPEADAPAQDEATGADGAPEGDAAAVPDPSGSDMWVLEATGDGAAELTWTQQPGRWTVLAVSTGGSAPRVSLAWPQVVTTPWLWPGVSVGTLLVLLAATLLVRDLRRARRGPEADWTPVLTGPLPAVGADGVPVQLTRRQLRELAAHGAVAGSGVAVPRDDSAVTRTDGPVAPEPEPEPGERGGTAPAAATSAADVPPLAAGAGRPGGRRAHRDPAAAPEPSSPSGAATAPARQQARGSAAAAPGPRAQAHGGHGAGAGPHATPTGGAAAPATEATSDAAGPGHGASAARPAWLSRTAGVAADGAAAAAPPPSGAPTASGAGAVPPSRVVPGAGAPRPGRVGGGGPTTGRPDADGPRAGGGARPGWAPVPPPPGAVVGRSAGPDAARGPRPPASATWPAGGPSADGPVARGPQPADLAAPRPAWLRDTPTPPGPRAAGDAQAPGDAAGSRADAWRRAWGLPPLPTDDESTEEGR